MAALKEAGVPEDHPTYINPPKFPSPDLGPAFAPGPSTVPEACSRAEAAQPESEVPQEDGVVLGEAVADPSA